MFAVKKLKNLLLYGGLERQDYLTIRRDIWDNNRKSLITYAEITDAGMLLLLVLSFFVPVLASSRMSYLGCVIVSSAMLILALGPAEKHPALIPVCVYTFTSIMLAFGIVLGTVIEPNQASASFGILIFAVPLLFTYMPIITDCQIAISIVVYVFAARATQSDDMFAFNMSVIMPYGIVGLILCALMMRVQIARQMLNHENKVLSEKDQLTGMLNRRCYEQKLEQLREGGDGINARFFAFDVNGLKHVNDTLGHHAGDELICAAADCIRRVFGRYGTCFRVGGDEFFAIIEGIAPTEAELRQELGRRSSVFRGVLVSGLSISLGTARCADGSDVNEAVQEADRQMYAHKEAYYQTANL